MYMLIKFSRKIMAINLILFPIKQMFVQKVTLNYSFLIMACIYLTSIGMCREMLRL